ncbi:MAG: hypothetical protein IIA48_11075 [Bacteroidetes bacterium]|nr:hypothetical protein [Bacteroidota bacterium]
MSRNKTLFSITVEDVQYEAKEKLGRKLTVEEIDIVKNGLEWGLLTGIDIVYNTIFEELKSQR